VPCNSYKQDQRLKHNSAVSPVCKLSAFHLKRRRSGRQQQTTSNTATAVIATDPPSKDTAPRLQTFPELANSIFRLRTSCNVEA